MLNLLGSGRGRPAVRPWRRGVPATAAVYPIRAPRGPGRGRRGGGAPRPRRREVNQLRGELERARVVPSREISGRVVTMNSEVLLRDLDSRQEFTCRLSYPDESDADCGRISVLAPVGTAILGYREGTVVEWNVPAGTRRLRIEKILYQPEAAGDFDR